MPFSSISVSYKQQVFQRERQAVANKPRFYSTGRMTQGFHGLSCELMRRLGNPIRSYQESKRDLQQQTPASCESASEPKESVLKTSIETFGTKE